MKWDEPGTHTGSTSADRSISALLLTGFLGSGKTTLLNRLLRDPQMADTAVVINEFGDVAIDHLLVESAIENAVVLQSGCICCTVRGDLVDTLLDLVAKHERGLIPAFSRVVIETTGLADPSPILRTFTAEKAVAQLYRVQAVIATIDTANGPRQLEEFEEARRQAAMADLLILTKGDLTGPAAGQSLSRMLRSLNPSAEIMMVENGLVPAGNIFAALPPEPAKADNLSRWLKAERFETPDNDSSAHTNEISSFAIVLDEPIEREALHGWLASLFSLQGNRILRMKGIVKVRDERGPVVIHAAGKLLHETRTLDEWPDGEHRTRIVFITRGLPHTGTYNSYLAALGWKGTQSQGETATTSRETGRLSQQSHGDGHAD